MDRRLDPARTPVGEVMATELVVAVADEDSQSVIRKMDQATIRHLPLASRGHLAPMLSIRDLLRVDVQDKGEELRYLRESPTRCCPASGAPRPAA